jgi:WD40 repeat protein
MQYQIVALKDGRLVYANITWAANIWLSDADPDAGRIGGTFVPATQDAMAKFSFELSRDGTELVFNAFGGVRGRRFEVRWKNLTGGEERTYDIRTVGYGQNPRISPNGKVFSFRDGPGERLQTYFVNGRDGSPRESCSGCMVLAFYDDQNFALVREGERSLARLNLSTGEKLPVLEADSGAIGEAVLAAGDRWLALLLEKPDGGEALYAVPLAAAPAPRKEWILICEDNQYLGSPAWSPNGRMLYYLSERDGNSSVWVQPFDPSSGRAAGPARVALAPKLSSLEFNNPRGNGRIAVALDKIAIWRGLSTGNIYMAKPKGK